MRDVAVSSYHQFQQKPPLPNLVQDELRALQKLSANKDLVIQKTDKGNSVAVLNRCDYVAKMESLLSDSSKFKKLSVPEDKWYGHIIQQERRIRSFLLSLQKKNFISSTDFGKLAPTGSRLGVLYGLCKVHKPAAGPCPPFRPILSAICTPQYNIAKYLVQLLAPWTSNEFSVKDSFSFASEIVQQDGSLFMGSLDVASLFTNIPLQETINICVNLVFGNEDSSDYTPCPEILSTVFWNWLVQIAPLCSMVSSTSNLMAWLWVHLWDQPWLIFS